MQRQEFIVRCASGFEGILTRELEDLKLKKLRPLKGCVAFFGHLKDAYKVCLWSRCASRVLLIVDRFDAKDAQELYDGVYKIDWTQHIGANATISIHTNGVNDMLKNSAFSSMKVKDAIVDKLRAQRGVRPDVKSFRPDVPINLSIRGNKAVLAIDLSGEPLHVRGYRQEGVQTAAPLKETLAAGILLLAGWKEMSKQDCCFFDPMCGSGTFAIEACGIALNMAPGIMRSYWGFQGWEGNDANLWDDLICEAEDVFEEAISHNIKLFSSDANAEVIEIAKSNAKRAGLAGKIHFECCDIAHAAKLSRRYLNSELQANGLVAINPPYGERMLTTSQIPALNNAISSCFEQLPSNWKAAIISPDTTIDAHLGMSPNTTINLYNGKIETGLKVYDLSNIKRSHISLVSLDGTDHTFKVNDKNSEQFASRLRKVAKEKMKQARKNDISCFRIYDADLPDYAVAIDLYYGVSGSEIYIPRGMEDPAQKARLIRSKLSKPNINKGFSDLFVHVSEYKAPSEIDEAKTARRLADVLSIVPLILDVKPEHVFVKTRSRSKGGSQYSGHERKSFVIYTLEDTLKFKCDMSSYLDTGLFLDHRITRGLVASKASGKKFLNLFAYTGSATVHAARGGATHTTTVDLSSTYLAWARENMEINGFYGSEHTYERGDVAAWISQERKTQNRYDLIFVDPPTFSNSKSMGNRTWSVQDDHAELLIGVSRLLSRDGEAIFSCNLRNFKPNYEKLAKYGVELKDITASTIAFDFERNQKIHHCYIVTRTQASPEK